MNILELIKTALKFGQTPRLPPKHQKITITIGESMRWKENQKHTGGSLEGEETQRHWITPVPCSWMQLDHLSVAFQLFLFASGLRRLARGISCSSPESPKHSHRVMSNHRHLTWPWRVTWVTHMQRPPSQSSLDQSASPPGFGLPSAQRLVSIGFPILRKWTTLIDVMEYECMGYLISPIV